MSLRSKRAIPSESCESPRLARDYDYLVRRWKSLARARRFEFELLAEDGGHPVFFARIPSHRPNAPRVYLSAGVHGDEPAGPTALLRWLEQTPDPDWEVWVFPCLNPAGLVANQRLTPDGVDLNRCYRDFSHSTVRAQQRRIGETRFDLALLLHEDYDACGSYLYETSQRKPFWGDSLIQSMRAHLPADPRRTIDGSRAKNAVIRRRIHPDLLPGWPEAFWLHYQHANRVFTVETPSEFHLSHRISAHVAVIQAATKRLCAPNVP